MGLGLGDVQGLMERVNEIGLDNNEDLFKKIKQCVFTLRDMCEQFENIQKMGPFGQVMSMIPGMANILGREGEEHAGKRIKRTMTMMKSMTDEELDHPSAGKLFRH